ncbi:MAG: type II and III secretion system protein [Sideroxydans sp.]|nr:type II and III secretion system protein [Sideroxydans sp.]
MKRFVIASLCIGTVACATFPEATKPSPQHIALPDTATPPNIPPLAESAPLPPPPVKTKSAERYSIVVNHIPVQEILFALARDAKLNIEIHPDISGAVTMNLIDQTLTEILDAIGRQVDMRYELNGHNLTIMPDIPYLKNYQIDYPNISREAKNNISIATSVATIGSGQTSGSSSSGSNASGSSIVNESNNQFWKTLVENIKDLLRETDKTLPEGSSETVVEQNNQQQVVPQPGSTAATPKANSSSKALAALPAQMQNQGSSVTRKVTYREAASVIANPESGIISVRATSRQHASVRDFIDKVTASAHRQVLIEATVVEVALSDQYQQGIDWSSLSTSATKGLSITQVTPTGALTGSMGTINYIFKNAFGGAADLSASIKLLESFGKLHVLSSPKLSVLNNQTSLLKVVDEAVYFTVDVTPGTFSNGVQVTAATYSTKVFTVPVGFLMYVTPQIGGNDDVTLNLRPTITRIIGYANDPNPVLAQNNLTNLIPQIQTREMESILRVRNGEIAILGGLMQDSRAGETNQIPGLGSVFAIGNAFKSRNDKNSKSELVIFLRPIILNQENQHDMLRLYKNSASQAEWQQQQINQEKAAP